MSAANKTLDFQIFHIQTESNYLRDKTRLKPTRILIQLMQNINESDTSDRRRNKANKTQRYRRIANLISRSDNEIT